MIFVRFKNCKKSALIEQAQPHQFIEKRDRVLSIIYNYRITLLPPKQCDQFLRFFMCSATLNLCFAGVPKTGS